MKLVLFFVLGCFLSSSYGHKYHSGECPPVESMSGFDMKKFLGIWYVVQKTSTSSSCIVYNISRGEEPGEYKIDQISQQAVLAIAPVQHEYSYTGDLTVIDPEIPGRFSVKFPLSVAGSSKFTVVMTDYENYGSIFTCQKIPFGHRQSATILSRTKDLDKIYTDKIRNRLASFSIDPFDLSIVSQTGCPKHADSSWNVHIDSDTFSAKSIANVFRKVGDKIGDGLEYTVNVTKKLYNKVTGDSATPGEENGRSAKLMAAEDKDAEWLP